MDWKNLKDNKCPKCESDMVEIGDDHGCSNCSFNMSHEKFEKIVNSLYRPKARVIEESENLSALNDL